MSSNFPMDPKKNEKNELFNGFLKSMNDFFQEKPVRGFLQSIDDFFSTPFPPTSFQVTLNETDKEAIIRASLPGVNKEQISIDCYNHHVTISVNHQEIMTEEDSNNVVFRKSQTFQRMSRTVHLSFPIDEKKVKASYQNGLLTIIIPKQKGKKVYIDQ